MTPVQLEDLGKRLRAEGDNDVPSSRRRNSEGHRRGVGTEVYRAALAAHLGIDMSGVQHAGAEARSRDHTEEMLSAFGA